MVFFRCVSSHVVGFPHAAVAATVAVAAAVAAAVVVAVAAVEHAFIHFSCFA